MKISFDVTDCHNPLKQGHLKMGECNKEGRSIQVNNRYLLYNDKPWIPVMGEFHYSRYDRTEWEAEILKMKAGGIRIVSSYLIWLHHEEEEGNFCFDGDRDLRYFAELCGKHGMFFMARLGPWVHGEVRNGGFPDWILQYNVRTNQEDYLYFVKRLFAAYYKQLKGLMFSDNGPVIGVQIENELVNRPEHLLQLKELAVKAGFQVPLYTVTAWAVSGIGEFPKYEFIPVFGSYPEAPWRQNTDPFERKPHYLFAPGRNDITIGSDLLNGFKVSRSEEELDEYPYAYCEIGPGVQATYHRRPVIRPYDLYTITMITLAKGNNLPGYYMYHGGRNPKGPLKLYQESRATGYPNDLPAVSYDFQAPVGEYGFLKPSYHYYKLLHLFLQQYGSRLAAMEAHYPDIAPKGRKDCYTPRCAVRTDSKGSGYLFLNTNQRNEQLDSIRNLQINIKTDSRNMLIPIDPIDIPAGISCFFPVNEQVEKSVLKYALAQPVTSVCHGGERYDFYTAVDGVPVEFLLDGKVERLNTRGRISNVKEGIRITDIPTGLEPSLSYETEINSPENGTDGGKLRINIIILKFMDALRLYSCEINGQQYLIFTDEGLYFEENAMILFGEAENGEFQFGVFPPIGVQETVWKGRRGIFEIGCISVRQSNVKVTLQETEKIILQHNPYVPYLFTKDLEQTKEYLLKVSVEERGDMDDLKILLDGELDVLQIYEEEELAGDCFHLGGLVEIGAKRFPDMFLHGKPVRIKASPYSEGKQVFLEQKTERDKVELSVYAWKPCYRKRLEFHKAEKGM